MSELFDPYLDRARGLAGELGLPATPAERVQRAIDLVDETAQVDADAPMHSNHPAGRVLKSGVGRLVRWYMLYLAGEVASLGSSVSWLGRAMFEYTASLEAELVRLRAEVDDLKARVGDR